MAYKYLKHLIIFNNNSRHLCGFPKKLCYIKKIELKSQLSAFLIAYRRSINKNFHIFVHDNNTNKLEAHNLIEIAACNNNIFCIHDDPRLLNSNYIYLVKTSDITDFNSYINFLCSTKLVYLTFQNYQLPLRVDQDVEQSLRFLNKQFVFCDNMEIRYTNRDNIAVTEHSSQDCVDSTICRTLFFVGFSETTSTDANSLTHLHFFVWKDHFRVSEFLRIIRKLDYDCFRKLKNMLVSVVKVKYERFQITVYDETKGDEMVETSTASFFMVMPRIEKYLNVGFIEHYKYKKHMMTEKACSAKEPNLYGYPFVVEAVSTVEEFREKYFWYGRMFIRRIGRRICEEGGFEEIRTGMFCLEKDDFVLLLLHEQ